ncbi:scd2/ral3 [Ephemerocybe angulata]|uniref:Scd2/ral3 n=1 Tax=Ephemerocybe angulata TaxID=980116 RepID=A0A8H6MEH1_9AGAR|nr:scd2/ral3 [Tulosesus angulatus]
MKSLRKSLNGNKDSSKLQISTPLPIPTTLSKPSSAILPPQKVIRALTTYKSQAPQELSFNKGDFFYVLKDAEDSAWYEAHNPVTGSRGIVPRAMFEEFSKNAMPNRASQFGAQSGAPVRSASSPGAPRGYGHAHGGQSPAVPKTQVYYAIVMHDFIAERPDELDAKRGDAITVVAQSNREWFVAKPIGKLGRPGLIPVAFVEIHDPATGKPLADVNTLIDRGDLPKVEEWKRAMLSYKQNSISLGVIDPPSRGSVVNSPFMPQEAFQTESEADRRPPTPDCLPEGILLSADVVSFHYEMEEYWFRIDAIFQPYGPPGQSRLPKAKQLILFRVYNDFYDFQVSLLNTFPREAGREPPHPRTLPFMPGPAKDVDDALTKTRKDELNEYVHALCTLSRSGARYILEHTAVRQFLSLKPGDIENEVEPRAREIDALVGGDVGDDLYAAEDYVNDMSDQIARMDVKGGRHSDGSDYEDEGYAPSPQQRPFDHHPYGQNQRHDRSLSREENLRMHAHSPSHHHSHSRTGSTSSFHTHQPQSAAPYGTPRTLSSHHERGSPTPPRNVEGSNGQSRWTDNTAYGAGPSTANSYQSSNSPPSRARSHSNANLTNPPISAANPQTAFVKIKIFDRVADDLIAIRVHPKVSHSELMEKVQSRLGSEVTVLKYRDSLTNTFVGLDSDAELRAWMDGTDKHVLYAD